MTLVRPLAAIAIVATAISFVLAAKSDSSAPPYGPHDWPMWGGTPARDNTPDGTNIPAEVVPGEFDAKTGAWK